MPADTIETNDNGRANFYLPNCKQLRMDVGKSINSLAKASDVDRATIGKMERKHPVTELVARKVFRTLNGWHGGSLNETKILTTKKPV